MFFIYGFSESAIGSKTMEAYMSDLSTLKFPTGRSVQQLKKDANRLKKTTNISLSEALNQCAKDNGVDLPWHEALRTLQQDTP